MAFNESLAGAHGKAPVDTDLIMDLHEALFRPSFDVGITDSAALHGWRNTSAGLTWLALHTVQRQEDPDLIFGLERLASHEDLAAVARVVRVHLEFGTIHALPGGQREAGLMDAVLLSSGFPWVSIRGEERVPFFPRDRAGTSGQGHGHLSSGSPCRFEDPQYPQAPKVNAQPPASVDGICDALETPPATKTARLRLPVGSAASISFHPKPIS